MTFAFAFALSLLAGCAYPNPFTLGSCGGDASGSEPASGMLVHVTVLNDANQKDRICYRFGGPVHSVDVARSGTAPNLVHGYDGPADGASIQAWRAGDDAIFSATVANASATETWYAIVTQSSGLRIETFDHAPAFD